MRWSDTPRDEEFASVERERNCLRIARKYGQRQLPTQVPQFEDDAAQSPPGAMTRANAQSLTFAANRQRWDRQKRLRSGNAAFLALLAVACHSPTEPSMGCTLTHFMPAPLGWSISVSEHRSVCPAPQGATTYGAYTVRWDD